MTTWDERLRELRSPTGEIVTEAQDAKANRYLKADSIRRTGSTDSNPAWGTRYEETDTYTLAPIKGCKETRIVKVRLFFDVDGTLMSAVYSCDCQRAEQGRTCSHVIAVHRYRVKPRGVAGDFLGSSLVPVSVPGGIAEDASAKGAAK